MSQSKLIISSIYEFRSCEVACDQSNSSIHAQLARFLKFIPTCSNSPECFAKHSDFCFSVEELVQLIEGLRSGGERCVCEWLPEYGCALIAVPILGGFKTRSCNMFLVALDEWQHTVHINIQDGLRTPTSVSLAQNVIMIGTVQRSDLLRFWATFRKILDETVKQATQQRDTGKKHHKTAGQISAVAKRALSLHASAANLEPEGGYTDVGQHTGCMKRNTAWPLVQAVVSFLMEQVMQQPRQFSPVDTAAIWALFDLWNARDLMTALAPSAGSIQAADIDDVCTILQSAVMRGENFFERGQVLWRAAWDELEQLVDDAAQRQVQRFSLLSCGDFAASHAHTRPLLRLTNASFDLQRLESTLAMKRADALRNLSSLPLLSLGCAASITALNSWLSGKLNGSNEQLELVLNTVDDWLYAKAAALFLSSSEVPASAVESLIESYRTALNNVKVSKHHSHGRMRTELRSRELLATWICYCLVHRAAGVEHPLVLTRSVCLDWSRLWVLVLSDKSAIDAQLAVCNYLQAQNARYKPVLFSLADEAATFAFAVEFGRADPELQRVLAQEKRYAEAREEKHWQEVEAKRARVAQLNVELDALLESRDELTRKLDVTPMHVELTNWKNGKTWWTRNRDYTNLGSQRESLDRVIRDKRSAIEYAERAPAAVIQPLPLDEDLALQFLFFLYTPPTLAVLACMGFMAQQMLLPRSFDDCPKDEAAFQKSVEVPNYKLSLDMHYQMCSKRIASQTSRNILLLMTNQEVPTNVPPATIHGCTTKRSGIWYPDSLTPHFAWDGGRFELDDYHVVQTQCWNPFKLNDEGMKYVALELTERLPESKLQCFMPQLGFDRTSADRSNVGIARPADHHYEWINKPISRAFIAMRAYPQKQVRSLVIALQDKTLPLDQLSVHGLLRQVLYQVGDISSAAGESQLSWKVDFDPERGEWLVKLVSALRELADELVSTPKNHLSMRIVAEIAAYASQWSSEARDCARSLSKIAYDWADGIAVTDATVSEITTESRAKQCLFCLYALCAHAYGPLSMTDAAHMCKLVVLIKNRRGLEGSTKYDAQIKELTTVQEHIMTRRVAELLPLVAADTTMLTAAVLTVMAEAPRDLQWTQLSGDRACFEAVSIDNHLFSLNVGSGIFLCDGKPLSRLPEAVRLHALFKRTFGDSNFEITYDAASGMLTTAREVSGCFYSFQLLAGNALHVTEKDAATGRCLRLLDHATIDQWARDFPPRLKELHSHWATEDGCVVVFRPVSFQGKAVSFVYRNGLCNRIPSHMQHQAWWQLSASDTAVFEQLALLLRKESLVTKLLSKFEDPNFIHVYTIGTTGQLKVHLPRFALEFQVNPGGKILSDDYRGFTLDSVQQFDDTLLGFAEYLVLRSGDATKVLVPKYAKLLYPGHVASNDAERKIYAYGVHSRFGTLQSNSIAGRLYLAALYAATGSTLPESRTGMTGDETAMRLLRECWVNRPLTEEENRNLHLLAQHTARNPALLLLCHFVYASSTQLDFLHEASAGTTAFANGSSLLLSAANVAAASEYMSNASQRNYRSRLTALEEKSIFGLACNLQSKHESRQGAAAERYRKQSYAPCSQVTQCSLVEDIEQELTSMVQLLPPASPTAFPLNTSALVSDKITMATVDDLQESFNAHQALPVESIDHLSPEAIHVACSAHQERVTAVRQALERHLLDQLDTAFPPSEVASPRFRMEKASNSAPSRLTSSDLLRIAADNPYMVAINPFFSAEAECAIREDIVLWLKLCVLEDKLQRLIKNSAPRNFNTAAVIQDLLCVRRWKAEDHIEWLVFEVEGRLQIRPAQYTVAMAIIENKGAIVQLNMGEGKTRVILPMLILYWGTHRGDSVVRLHFLTQLLDDGYAHFHEYLCASALNRKIFVLPFNRDVVMSEERAEVMYATLEFCRQSRGCVLVAPEHRLSFELKKHELQLSRPEGYEDTCAGIDAVAGLRYIDMLDESDEVLRHKYQLIYSVGDHSALEGGTSRWVMAQNVLEVLETDSRVRAVLDRSDVTARDSAEVQRQAFNPVRFVPGHCLSNAEADLCNAIAMSVFDKQSYELNWLTLVTEPTCRNAMLRFVTDNAFSIDEMTCAMAAHPHLLTEKRLDDLMALRGLLVYRTLFTAMEKRHRVNYGVKRSEGSKRIAVPFKASDTPSERSEFNHPDMAILLTTLSYFYDGLSRAEILEAFRALLSLHESAQAKVYAEWLSICAEVPSTINSISKIDLSNDEQVCLLQRCFDHNRQTINFWLNACVLPNETKQYSHKLIANAWNIATNITADCMGFAGTDDTSHLLPIQVVKHHTADQALRATNGLMLARLLSANNAQFSPLHQGDAEDNQVQRTLLLDRVAEGKFRALIDAGALCTGSSNVEVADYLLERIDQTQFSGVVYFDDVIQKWCTKDFVGCVAPLSQSSLHERDCLVFFDESRCRGADMKLHQTAHAVLTLGLKMCKDKLMQAVGRLRQFGKGQRVTVVAAEDVTQQIVTLNRLSCASEITMPHALLWVLGNTVEAIKAGMAEWAYQGLYYCTTHGNSDLVQLEEKCTLRDYYTEALTAKTVAAAVGKFKAFFNSRVTVGAGAKGVTEIWALSHKLSQFAEAYGSDVFICSGTNEEEAEKQLEKEVEKEIEKEVQLPSMTAVCETDWDYRALLTARDATVFNGMVYKLDGAIKTLCSHSLGLRALPFESVSIYCTHNYAHTIKERAGMEEYLRCTDVYLDYKDQSIVVLLSDREADAVLSLVLRHREHAFPFQVKHLSETKREASLVNVPQQRPQKAVVPNFRAFLLMLLEGDTAYPKGSAVAAAMHSVLKGNLAAQQAARKIPGFRGKSHLLPMSDLEQACVESL